MNPDLRAIPFVTAHRRRSLPRAGRGPQTALDRFGKMEKPNRFFRSRKGRPMTAARLCLALMMSYAWTVQLFGLETPSGPKPKEDGVSVTPVCHCKKKFPYTTYSVEPMFPLPPPVSPIAPPCISEPSAPGVLEVPPPTPGALPPQVPPDDLELPTPAVSIRVEVATQSAVGQELEYRITAANRSAAAAHHVLVRCRLPDNVRYVRSVPAAMVLGRELTWELGTVQPGSRHDIQLILVPSGGEEVDLAVRVQFEHGVRVRTQLARSALRLQKSGPGEAQPGETLTYRLSVTNTGTVPVGNVVIVDELPDGLETRDGRRVLSFSLGTLGVGDSRQFAYEVIARRPGRFVNRATVTADGGLRDEVQAVIVVSEPALDLRISAPSEMSFGRSLAAELTVSNTGSTPLGNVVVTAPIPAGTGLVSASDGGRQVGSQVEWQLGTLPPGAKETLELKLRPTTAGRVVILAEARSDRGLRVTADAATVIVGEAGLLLEVVDLEDPVEVGGDTQYNIIIRNQGSAPTTNIRITAFVPPELAVSRVQGPTDHTKEDGKIVFEPLNLPPMRDTIYRVYVRALKAGDVRFRVELTADQLPAGPLREEESTNIHPPQVR